jgi:hypothetical protein
VSPRDIVCLRNISTLHKRDYDDNNNNDNNMQIQKSTQEQITLWVLGGTHYKLYFHLHTAITSLSSHSDFTRYLTKWNLHIFTTPKELEYWAAFLSALFCVHVSSWKFCVRSFNFLYFSANSPPRYEWETHLEVFFERKNKVKERG